MAPAAFEALHIYGSLSVDAIAPYFLMHACGLRLEFAQPPVACLFSVAPASEEECQPPPRAVAPAPLVVFATFVLEIQQVLSLTPPA